MAPERETKYVIRNSAAGILRQWLENRCWSDPEFSAGIVHSIYYDTRDWRFLREKINSDYLKTKIRIRWYVDIDSREPGEASFLEAKFKVGHCRKKVRIPTDYSGRELSRINLDHQRLLELPALLRPEGVVVAGRLAPVFEICYKRRRFVEPITQARLCLDYNIQAPRVNRQVLSRSNPFALQDAVFEMKGPLDELPQVLHQLTGLGCQKESFSKYYVCYKKINRIMF